MEKPFLKVNATFPHGGRGESPRLGTSGCDYTGRIEFDKKPQVKKKQIIRNEWLCYAIMLHCGRGCCADVGRVTSKELEMHRNE